MNNKITFSETWKLSLRAFRLLFSSAPSCFLSILWYNLCSALHPYTTIYLSAQIINELAGNRNPDRLWKYVALTLLISVVFELGKSILLRWKDESWNIFWNSCDQTYATKSMDLDFCDLDSQYVLDLRAQIYQCQQWASWGFQKIYYQYWNDLTKAVFNLTGALVLSIGLFTSPVPASNTKLIFLNHPLFLAALVIILLLITYLSPLCANNAEKYWAISDEDARLSNRMFGFWGFTLLQKERADDMRIYNQHSLAGYHFTKENAFTPQGITARFAKGPMGLWSAASAAVSVLFTAAVYLFVCLKAWAGAFGVGSVTQYISAVTALSQNLSTLFGTLGSLKNNAEFLSTTFEFLDIPNNMYQGSLTTEKRSDGDYEVEFRDVSFKYPASDTYALRHVSMKFRVGQKLAVVGRNGSGKTTFIKLLCRLYDPTEGQILLNGIDIRKYNYRDYMNIFSVVFQDFRLLSFPLAQNVAASVRYDEKRVLDCLEKAGFLQQLSKMPDGLDTCLYRDFSDKGVELSGGEAQKVALARALYHDAAFVILDEPTAALDPIAESEIYSRFNELIGHKTAIYISHRLSSCRFCDDIAVFDNGRVVQRGSHDELVEDTNGMYHELWNAQAQYYQEA